MAGTTGLMLKGRTDSQRLKPDSGRAIPLTHGPGPQCGTLTARAGMVRLPSPGITHQPLATVGAQQGIDSARPIGPDEISAL